MAEYGDHGLVDNPCCASCGLDRVRLAEAVQEAVTILQALRPTDAPDEVMADWAWAMAWLTTGALQPLVRDRAEGE